MCVRFSTGNAAALFRAFNQAIDNHQRNVTGQRIDTWRYVLHQGNYFYTHTSPNWRNKAWFRADISDDRLTFVILSYEQVPLTRDTYAYYAGHLIETFIRHFPNGFTIAQAIPNAAEGDEHF